MSLGGLALLVAIGLVVFMTAAWLAQRLTGNSGWVDVTWSFATGLAGVGFALLPLDGAAPAGWRQWAVAALVAAWSVRLGGHIAVRAAAGQEDPRYADLKRQWGANFPWRLYVFLMIQAAVAFGLAISMGLAARNPAAFGAADGFGLVVLAVAILGEAASDSALRRFKADPANRGRVCDAGLWAWSRHPNYFFEWLGWVAYPCFALSGLWPWGWLALTGPALMFWTLRYASGVPPLEDHMRRRYGAAWAEYEARTAVFFPWPPHRESAG
jgi:steroid 5-alpha reductase family enzyme